MFHIWEFNDSIVTHRKSYAKIFWWHILAPNLVPLQPNCDQAEIRLHALLLIYVTRFLKARAVKRELYQIMWQCVSAWRKLDVTTLLYWRVRAGSDWRPALSACQTHPKSLSEIKEPSLWHFEKCHVWQPLKATANLLPLLHVLKSLFLSKAAWEWQTREQSRHFSISNFRAVCSSFPPC